MTAKLEWTQSNAQQNIEQLQNPTMGVTINNESTTTEPPPITVCSYGILLKGSSTLYGIYIGFCPRTEFDRIL